MRGARVLFLCTGNSARSLLAEALLRHLGGPDFEAHSAGTHPKGVNPYTEQALARAGITAEGLRSKSLDEYLDQRFEHVITVCDSAAEECPTFPGTPNRIHWSFPDPAAVEGSDADKLAAFQQTLEGMRPRVAAFIEAARSASPAASEERSRQWQN